MSKSMGEPRIESLHDKLRDELLNREIFGSFREARVILESRRCEYIEDSQPVRWGIRLRVRGLLRNSASTCCLNSISQLKQRSTNK